MKNTTDHTSKRNKIEPEGKTRIVLEKKNRKTK